MPHTQVFANLIMGYKGIIQSYTALTVASFKSRMKKSFVVSVVISVLCSVRYASSILCYDCNSEYDPRCGEHFDPFSLGIINCSLKDPPEHLDVGEPTFCRSIKMEIDSKVRVVRQCGYLADEDVAEHPCRRVVGNGDLFVTYCTCNTDLCNTASTMHRETALFIGFIFVLLLIS